MHKLATHDMIMYEKEKFKRNKELRGDSLFRSLIAHDCIDQLDKLSKYLNTFKPSKNLKEKAKANLRSYSL